MIGGFEGSDLVRAFLVIGFALVFVWLWRTRPRVGSSSDPIPPRQASAPRVPRQR